jgi:hypothetical protein
VKVRYVLSGSRVEKDIDADRITLLGGTLVFSKATTPPSTSEIVLLAIPQEKLLDARGDSDA